MLSLRMNFSSVMSVHPELPIYLLRTPIGGIFYVPGLVSRADPSRLSHTCPLPEDENKFLLRSDGVAIPAGLIDAACRVRDLWSRHAEADFAPECLNIYLSNRCNLSCSYCSFADNRDPRLPVIREEAVAAAARLVAQYCAAGNKSFQLVIHGSGEPTIHFALLQRLVRLTRGIACDAGISWRAHIATNGALPEGEARWLARHFSTVGLSCDGPQEIHDAVRPLPGGAGSYHDVERTARAVRDAGGILMVRATILPETVDRQEEIVEHLVRRLGASNIRFEPVYRQGRLGRPPFQADRAGEFVKNFMAAESRAARLGANLSYSGVRLDELHGPFCNVLRDVLHLLPDGSATNCFLMPEGLSADGRRTAIGHHDAATGRFILEHDKIRRLRMRAAAIADQCKDCVCCYHCARACPDVCSGMEEPDADPAGTFRCLVAQGLCKEWIANAVTQASQDQARTFETSSETDDMRNERAHLETLLEDVPPDIEAERIRTEYCRVRRFLRIESGDLPKPIWAERGFEHDPARTWEILKGEIQKCGAVHPISIYLHIPFCEDRCPFCDCHSVVSGTPGRSRKVNLFSQIMLREIEMWAALPDLCDRPVTTVHLGGGTPNHLDPLLFASILKACRSGFKIGGATEWALESTSRLLDEAHLQWLRELGFSRLHVGVQTLEEQIRCRIGRKDAPALVLSKLVRAIAGGFVVSVDLIYGLPDQTSRGFAMTIRRLVDLGVHGFSLYRFQRTPRNRGFWSRQANPRGDRLHEYVLFQCAEQILASAGYRKNHFAHFAQSEDADLYYRHAVRGEDLLAMGPTADGVFSSYHYRHPKLEDYLSAANGIRPALEGGLWEDDSERGMRGLAASLMAAEIHGPLLDFIRESGLIERWLEAGLLAGDPGHDTWSLTANGSWFLSDMLKQLKEAMKD